MKRVAIIGAGGHGRVVADILQAMNSAGSTVEFAGFIDRTPGEGIIGTDDDLETIKQSHGVNAFIVGIGSLRGGSHTRARLFETYLNAGLEPTSAVHPRAVVADSAAIGAGTAVMAGAILNPGVRIGLNAIINTGAIIDHDCRLGDHTHIAPGAVMSGDVTVGANALVGVGAVVRQGISIGDGATIGAGATVVSDIAAGQTAIGTPARRL